MPKVKKISRLILLRHGQSEWNKKNIFTGWVDIPLSSEGIEEALASGQRIQNIPIDIIFTSTLNRGLMTALLAMSVHRSGKVTVVEPSSDDPHAEWRRCYSDQTLKTLIPIITAWQLNERMYGQLQGLNKEMMRQKYGPEQVQLWRRSYDSAPPGGESLKMTAQRTLPYFQNQIVPELQRGKNVLISAHGNSLRSIVMQLDGLSEKEVVELEIPTGIPLFYEFTDAGFVKE